jgi:type I restriction enzyme S subunit
MAVKKGYKQTEVGVIPEDWTVSSLANLLVTKQLGGNYRNSEQESDYPLIKMGNIGRGTIYLDKLHYIGQKQHADEKDKLQFNDVLFNTRNTLELVGKVGIWREELPVAYFNSNIMRMQFDDAIVSSNVFMCYILNTPKTLAFLRGAAIGTTSVAAIYSRDFVYIPIPVPTLAEQEAIAGALSDADAWIESLEQLIAKKRQIKQGAMQELLTGKRRLPGFSGQWEKKRLGDVANVKTGSKNNEDKVDDGEFPFFVRSDTVERINTFSHDCEAILVPGEGRIGDIFHYISGRFDVHQRVYAITRFVETVSPRFLYFYLKKSFGVWAMQNTVKATVDSLRLPTFTCFEMKLPSSLQEQTSIATVLSDMDTEIGSLESKLAKAREIKQGMMQELLTGKIRLV